MQEKTSCLVLSPSTTLWDQQTLFAIHGQGDSIRRFAQRWSPLVNEGWTLVLPEWTRLDLAAGQLRVHLEECGSRRGLDPSRTIVAGVAEGAALALEMAGGAGLPWLCALPRWPAGHQPPAPAAACRHTRGLFLLGENDPLNELVEPIISALRGAGFDLDVRVLPGAGSELPDSFAEVVSAALRNLPLG